MVPPRFSIFILRHVRRRLCDLYDNQSRSEIRNQESDGLPLDLFLGRKCFRHGDQGVHCVLYVVDGMLIGVA